MLILTRRVGETLMIGDEVTVTVLGVKGNQVRIGINAPKDVAVRVPETPRLRVPAAVPDRRSIEPKTLRSFPRRLRARRRDSLRCVACCLPLDTSKKKEAPRLWGLGH